ncbi:MAG: hypothetical protein AVDCRST_MAG93-5258, partial [uncultured Chloroflexia bacterium]
CITGISDKHTYPASDMHQPKARSEPDGITTAHGTLRWREPVWI